MSLYGSQDPAQQQQQQAPQPNYFGAPPPQQTPNYYGTPPPQQPGQPQNIYGAAPAQEPQPNYYGAPPAQPQQQQPPNYYGAPQGQPPTGEPYGTTPPAQQPPNYYGAPPQASGQPPAGQPVDNTPPSEQPPQNVIPTTTPVQGLVETTRGVWCATTNTVTPIGMIHLCLGIVGVGILAYAAVVLISRQFMIGGFFLVLGLVLGVHGKNILYPELGAYSSEFDCNARMVKITSSKILLASCTTKTQEVRFSDIHKVAHQKDGDGAAFFLLLTSGERVMFRSRVVLCSQRNFGPEDDDKVASRFATIINSAGFSVGTEVFVKSQTKQN